MYMYTGQDSLGENSKELVEFVCRNRSSRSYFLVLYTPLNICSDLFSSIMCSFVKQHILANYKVSGNIVPPACVDSQEARVSKCVWVTMATVYGTTSLTQKRMDVIIWEQNRCSRQVSL